MTRFALRRAVMLLPTLFGVSLLAFALSHLAPGDPAESFLRRTTDQPPTQAEIAAVRQELGLDRPFPVQYVRWAARAATGDLGISYSTRRPVRRELVRRIPATLQIAVPAAVLAVLVAIPLGTLSAVYRNRLLDQVLRVAALAGASLPSFWLALILILLFSVTFSLVPVAGRHGLSSFVLPIVVLTVTPAAVLARFTRSVVLEALGAEHVRTARAKGLRQMVVTARHTLRPALIPLVTTFGTSLGHVLAGAAVIETIFAWPGVGKLAIDAILQRDYPMIQGFVLYTGTAFVAINFLVDLSYVAIDPRVRLTGLHEEAAR